MPQTNARGTRRPQQAAVVANAGFTPGGAPSAYANPNSNAEQYDGVGAAAASTTTTYSVPSANRETYRTVRLDGGGGGDNNLDGAESSSDVYYSTVNDAPPSPRGRNQTTRAAPEDASAVGLQRRTSVAIDKRIEAAKQKRNHNLGIGLGSVLLLIAFVLGAVASSRISALSASHETLASNHETLASNHDALSASHDALSANLATLTASHDILAAQLRDIQSKEAAEQSTGMVVPVVGQEGSMPECTNSTPPSLVYTRNADLGVDTVQSCSNLFGAAAWRPMMMLGGLIHEGSNPSAFAAAVSSGLPGIHVLRLWAAEVVSIDRSLTIFARQDVRVLFKVGASEQPALTFKGDVVIDADASLQVFFEVGGSEQPSLIFEGGVKVGADASLSIISVAAREEDAASMAAARVGLQRYLTLGDGATLIVDGKVEIDTSAVLFACANPATNSGNCTLSNGVVFNMPDGRLVAMRGALPGSWTATGVDGVTVGTVSRNGSAAALPTFSPPGWQLPFIAAINVYSSGAQGNKHGKAFLLYLLPLPAKYFWGTGARRIYEAACISAGLKIVASGYGDYFDTVCGTTPELCMPLVANGDNNWGSTSDVNDKIAAETGWTNFVISYYSDKDFVYNYPGDTGGFDAMKRPVCGIETGDVRSGGQQSCESGSTCPISYTFSSLDGVRSALLSVEMYGDLDDSGENAEVTIGGNVIATCATGVSATWKTAPACAALQVAAYAASAGSLTVVVNPSAEVDGAFYVQLHLVVEF